MIYILRKEEREGGREREAVRGALVHNNTPREIPIKTMNARIMMQRIF